MIKKLFTSFKEIGFLTIALTLALCANFAFGAWSNPPANPPSNNTAAPINVSSASQVKQGALDVGGLSVNGDQLIDDASPSIKFNDTNARDFWLHANSDQLYLLGDRNDSGTWDSAYPARFYLGSTAASDYVKFSNRVLATAYCDENGNNCTDASAGPADEVDPQVGTLDSGKWCRSNNAGTAIWCGEDVPVKDEVDPQVGTIQSGKYCVGNSNGTAVTCSANAPSTPAPNCSLASRTYRQCRSYPGCGSGEVLVESRRSGDDSCTGTGNNGDMHYSTCLAVTCS